MSRKHRRKKSRTLPSQHTRKIPGGQEVCIDRIKCPHCLRTGVAYAFARFHFNNCKLYGLQSSLESA